MCTHGIVLIDSEGYGECARCHWQYSWKVDPRYGDLFNGRAVGSDLWRALSGLAPWDEPDQIPFGPLS